MDQEQTKKNVKNENRYCANIGKLFDEHIGFTIAFYIVGFLLIAFVIPLVLMIIVYNKIPQPWSFVLMLIILHSTLPLYLPLIILDFDVMAFYRAMLCPIIKPIKWLFRHLQQIPF